MQTVPSSVYPWLQVQVKLPGMLAQVASAAQLLIPVAHSSISVTSGGNHVHKILHSYLPIQTVPSPVYPRLQVQVKLPGVFVQVASAAQLLASVAHKSA